MRRSVLGLANCLLFVWILVIFTTTVCAQQIVASYSVFDHRLAVPTSSAWQNDTLFVTFQGWGVYSFDENCDLVPLEKSGSMIADVLTQGEVLWGTCADTLFRRVGFDNWQRIGCYSMPVQDLHGRLFVVDADSLYQLSVTDNSQLSMQGVMTNPVGRIAATHFAVVDDTLVIFNSLMKDILVHTFDGRLIASCDNPLYYGTQTILPLSDGSLAISSAATGYQLHFILPGTLRNINPKKYSVKNVGIETGMPRRAVVDDNAGFVVLNRGPHPSYVFVYNTVEATPISFPFNENSWGTSICRGDSLWYGYYHAGTLHVVHDDYGLIATHEFGHEKEAEVFGLTNPKVSGATIREDPIAIGVAHTKDQSIAGHYPMLFKTPRYDSSADRLDVNLRTGIEYGFYYHRLNENGSECAIIDNVVAYRDSADREWQTVLRGMYWSKGCQYLGSGVLFVHDMTDSIHISLDYGKSFVRSIVPRSSLYWCAVEDSALYLLGDRHVLKFDLTNEGSLEPVATLPLTRGTDPNALRIENDVVRFATFARVLNDSLQEYRVKKIVVHEWNVGAGTHDTAVVELESDFEQGEFVVAASNDSVMIFASDHGRSRFYLIDDKVLLVDTLIDLTSCREFDPWYRLKHVYDTAGVWWLYNELSNSILALDVHRKVQPPRASGDCVDPDCFPIEVWPNPSNSVIRINVDREISEVDIYDVVGNVNLISNETTIDVSGLIPGWYGIICQGKKGGVGYGVLVVSP